MTAFDQLIDRIFTHHRWLVHIGFWFIVFTFYVSFFGRKNDDYVITFLFIGLLMPVTIGTTYFINYFLVPRFLMKARYGLFGLFFLYTLIGSLFIEMIISFSVFIVVAKLNIQSMSPASIDIFFLMTSLLVVLFLGVAIKMLMHWRKSREDYQNLMRDKVEAELKFLKMQLNPHFLFNTLNNLYSLATEKSDKTPQAILALSELLDYVLHDTQVDFVPLEKEIQHVKNYIALESLRYEDRLRLDLKIEGDARLNKIVPMLLITLTDNAFKHGVRSSVDDAWISITLDSSHEKVSIQVSNSVGQNNKKLSGYGIGLENLKSQLKLLYGDRHSILVTDSETSFQVNIELNAI